VSDDIAEYEARVAADEARLKAKVAEELPVALRRQLEVVHDTGKPKSGSKPKL